MVCATSKLSPSNVSRAGSTVPSAVFELVRSTVNVPTGGEVSATVNVAVPPVSFVRSPCAGVTATSPPPTRMLSPHAVPNTTSAQTSPRTTPQVVLIGGQGNGPPCPMGYPRVQATRSLPGHLAVPLPDAEPAARIAVVETPVACVRALVSEALREAVRRKATLAVGPVLLEARVVGEPQLVEWGAGQDPVADDREHDIGLCRRLERHRLAMLADLGAVDEDLEQVASARDLVADTEPVTGVRDLVLGEEVAGDVVVVTAEPQDPLVGIVGQDEEAVLRGQLDVAEERFGIGERAEMIAMLQHHELAARIALVLEPVGVDVERRDVVRVLAQ